MEDKWPSAQNFVSFKKKKKKSPQSGAPEQQQVFVLLSALFSLTPPPEGQRNRISLGLRPKQAAKQSWLRI